MNIVPLFAGMGNQMFMYAFYLALKQRDKNTFCTECVLKGDKVHSGYDLGRAFGISTDRNTVLDSFVKLMMKAYRCLPPFLFRMMTAFLGVHFVREVKGVYEASYLEQKKRISFFFGYWASEQYFLAVRDEIRQVFRFRTENLSAETRVLERQIRSCPSGVALHVRRGDFVSGNMTLENTYYEKAIDVLKQHVSDPVFFVFSDDPAYVRTMNLPNAVYVDCNKGTDAWQDMFLMSVCRHNIIANSTFSWWGAYLNGHKGKIVVAPEEMRVFNRDIFPEGYIVI